MFKNIMAYLGFGKSDLFERPAIIEGLGEGKLVGEGEEIWCFQFEINDVPIMVNYNKGEIDLGAIEMAKVIDEKWMKNAIDFGVKVIPHEEREVWGSLSGDWELCSIDVSDAIGFMIELCNSCDLDGIYRISINDGNWAYEGRDD